MLIYSYALFLLWDQWITKKLSELMNTDLVCDKFSLSHCRLSSKFHLTSKKNLKSIKTFLTLKLSWYCKSGSTFSSRKQYFNCCLLGNTLFLCLLVLWTPTCPGSGWKARELLSSPKSSDIGFWGQFLHSISSYVFCNSLQEWVLIDRQGLELGLKFGFCSLQVINKL